MTRSEISAAVGLAKAWPIWSAWWDRQTSGPENFPEPDAPLDGDSVKLCDVLSSALLALHAEVSRMRPVWDAAVEWQRTYRLPFAPTGCSEHRRSSLMLAEAIDTARQGADTSKAVP